MDLDLNSIYCSGLSLSYLLLVTSPEFSYGEFDMRERFCAGSSGVVLPILQPANILFSIPPPLYL
jgi:hypothetical protein